MSDNIKLCMGCMNPLGDDNRCRVCGYVEGTPYLPTYLAPHTVLNNRYIVGRLISYNGEGSTYIAYDKVINKTVNIREFFPDTLCIRVKGSQLVSINPNKLVQFKNLMSEFIDLYRSILKMRTLTHINAAYEVFNENNTAYAVLEHIEGITLKQYLQENAGELSWMEIKQLFPPLFTTLSLIHNASIVHKGLSLDTIYYTNRNELMITGFCTSAARSSGSDLAPELFSGFAAPEQYRANAWLGTWTDVYALSAILYRCLTGCMPTDSISRIGNDNMLEPYAINPVTPQHVSRIIMNGLRIDNEVRIQTVTELVTKLFEVPDFSARRQEHTSTVIIPKQPVGKRPQSNTPSNTPNESLDNNGKRASATRIYLYVLGAFIALLIFVVVIVLIYLSVNKNDNQNENGNNDVHSQSTSIQTESEDEPQESSEPASSSKPEPVHETVVIGNYVGSLFNDVKNQIGDKIEIKIEYEYNDDFDENIVFEQSIKPDEKVEVGSKLTIKVSEGPKNVIVPDFNNISVKDYKQRLDSMKIKYSIQTNNQNVNENTDNWHVTATSISPGSPIDRTGQELIIYVQK